MFERVYSGAPWEQTNGYCRALRAGFNLYVTGTTSIDGSGRVVGAGDPGAQVARIYEIIEGALFGLGADRFAITRSRMFVTDMSRASEFGRAHAAFFGSHRPCLTLVGIASLIDPSMLVEIECDGYHRPGLWRQLSRSLRGPKI